ncbi:MAG TPA: bifunctional riboflavin kinase/FAD synthetase, partial [Deltaproteobacteria bacterium]|nr:bifunctional riboflavin kinase/FAD synthetase [Deltaproteobacteria bacterium]
VRVDDSIVGCTLIRQHICNGDLDSAAQLQRRYHFVRGAVVRGRGRGRTIGFPTANIDPKTELIPPAGVYAVCLQVGNSQDLLPGVANLGFRPTFAEKKFAIEVHLFDWSGDLYGERVRVHFVGRVRDEMRFDGPEELVQQIHRDIAQVRSSLPFPPPPQSRVTWDPKPDKVAGQS